MGRDVAIVTDSTAYLPPKSAAAAGVWVVPLQVVVDGRSLDEGTAFGQRELTEALRRRVRVSTSRPSPRAFLDAYQSVVSAGASAVVSVHISGHLSGTGDAARLAAKDAPVPVEVVDSHSLGMGLGYAVLSCAEAADLGGPVEHVAEVGRRRAERTSTFFYVDTLEYLRRGGRIGAAQALLGTALAVKPLLHLQNGEIQPLGWRSWRWSEPGPSPSTSLCITLTMPSGPTRWRNACRRGCRLWGSWSSRKWAP